MSETIGTFKIAGHPRIRLRTPRMVYARLLLRDALLYTVAFAIGCFLFHMLTFQESTLFNERIRAYFSADFTGCDSLFSYADRLLTYSKQDLSDLFLLFTVGFTMFAGLATAAILMFRGFSLGFSISYLAFLLKSEAVSPSVTYTDIALFSALSAVCAALMIHFSVKTVLFSDAFKALCGRPSRILRSGDFYAQIFRFLVAFGAILILNLIRCVI